MLAPFLWPLHHSRINIRGAEHNLQTHHGSQNNIKYLNFVMWFTAALLPKAFQCKKEAQGCTQTQSLYHELLLRISPSIIFSKSPNVISVRDFSHFLFWYVKWIITRGFSFAALSRRWCEPLLAFLLKDYYFRFWLNWLPTKSSC